MELSKRLLMSASMVSKGNRVADIGCDHAHTSIWLIQQGIAKNCIAMDLRKGPLAHADENIRMCRCENEIQTRLSDGLTALKPGEADCILITGMGGGLMTRILTDGLECVEQAQELILQPQSDQGAVRRFIYSHGFSISEERCCKDYGKFYISIHAVKGKKLEEPYSDSEFEFGRILPAEGNPVYRDYLQNEYRKALLVKEQLETNETEKARERLPEFNFGLDLLKQAINKFEMCFK